MEIRRPLSSICRGTGTWSGDVLRTTPLPFAKDIDHIEQNHGYMNKGTLKLPNISSNENRVPKTFATRHGALLLFADTYKVWRKQLKQKRIDSQEDGKEKVVQQLKTLKELRRLVLSFGLDDESVIKRISAILNDDSLIQVRPGFSPDRYTSSAVRLWDPKLVDKYLENDGINKSVVQKYFELLLPDVTVNGIVLKDTLLGSKPQKYTSVRLPKLQNEKHRQIDSDEMDRHKTEFRKKPNVMVLPKIDFTTAPNLPKKIDHREFLQKHNIKKNLMDPNQKKFWNNYENLSYDEKADLLFRMLVSRRQDGASENGNNILSSARSEKSHQRKCVFPDLKDANYYPLQVNPVTSKQKDNKPQNELPLIMNPNIKSPSKNKSSKNQHKPTDNKTHSIRILSGCDVESTERVELPKFIYRPSKLTSYGISHLNQSKHKDKRSNGLVIQGTAFNRNDDNYSFASTDIPDTRPNSLPSFPSLSSNDDVFKNYVNITSRYDNNDTLPVNSAMMNYNNITTPYNRNDNLSSKTTPNLLRDNFFASPESVNSSIGDDTERADSANFKIEGHSLLKLPNDLNDSTCSSNIIKSNVQSIEMDLSSQHSNSYISKEISGSVASTIKKKVDASSSASSSVRSTIKEEISESDSVNSSLENVSYKDDASDISTKIEHESDVSSQYSSSSFKKKETSDSSKLQKEFPIAMVTSDMFLNAKVEGNVSSNTSIKSNNVDRISHENDIDAMNDDVPSMLPELIINEEHQPGFLSTSGDTNIMITNDSHEVRSPLKRDVQKVEDCALLKDDVQEMTDSLPLKGDVQKVEDSALLKDDVQEVTDSLPLKGDVQKVEDNAVLKDHVQEVTDSLPLKGDVQKVGNTATHTDHIQDVSDSLLHKGNVKKVKSGRPHKGHIQDVSDSLHIKGGVQKVEDTSPHKDHVQVVSDSLPLKQDVQNVEDSTSHKGDIHDVADLRDSSPVLSDVTAVIESKPDTLYVPASTEYVDNINQFTKDTHTTNGSSSSNKLNITEADKGKFSEGSVTIIVNDSDIEEDKDYKMSDVDLSNEDASRSPTHLDEDSDVREESDSYLSSSSLKNISSSSLDEDVDIKDRIKSSGGSMENRLNVIIQEVLCRPGSGIDLQKDLSAAAEVYKTEILKEMESNEVEEEEEEKEEDEGKEEERKVTPEKTMTLPANVLQENQQIKDNVGVKVESEVKAKVDPNVDGNMVNLVENEAVLHENEAVLDEKEEVVTPKPEPFRAGTSMEEKPKYLESHPKKSDKKVSQGKKKSNDKKSKDMKKVIKKSKPPLKVPPVNEMKIKTNMGEKQNLEADLKSHSVSLKNEEEISSLQSIPQTTETQQEEMSPSNSDIIATTMQQERSPSLKASSSKSDLSRSSSTDEYIIRRSPDESSVIIGKEETPSVVSEQKSVKSELDSEKEIKASVKKEKREKSAAERRAAVENKRKLLEEKRRLEKEEKLRETELYILKVQEEDRRNQQLQLEMEEELQRQEEEKKRALQMEKERLEAEEIERKRREEEPEKLRKKKLAEEEAQRKKMEILMAERQMELDFKKAQEEMAKAIEADMAEKERVLMEQMAEEERRLYEEQKRLEEALRVKEDEERARLLEIKRKEEEEKRERELEELLKIETKQLFTSSARRTNRLLEIQHQVSRAYTYSYFNLLPIIFYGTSNPIPKKRVRKVANLSDVLDKLEDIPDQ